MTDKKNKPQPKNKVQTKAQDDTQPGKDVKYNENTEIVCACGAKFTVGSTEPGPIRVSLCSKCHPFYTGEQKIVDTDDLVSKYKQKEEKALKQAKSRKVRREEKRAARSKVKAAKKDDTESLTLKDIMKALQKDK